MTAELEPTPTARLSLWLTTNAGLPDEPSHEQVTRLIDWMGGSSIPDALDVVRELEQSEERYLTAEEQS